MKTLNRKYTIMLIISAAVVAASLLMTTEPTTQPAENKLAIEHESKPSPIILKKESPTISVQTPSEPFKQSSVKKIKPVEAEPSQFYSETVEVLQETYVEEEILDENWDEEAYVEEQRRLMEYMSEEELAVRAQIQALEAELYQAHDDLEMDETMLTQMEQLLKTDDEYSPQLLDLQCSSTLCRVAIDVADEYSQLEVLDSFPNQLKWVEQSYADVTVKPDDSRMLTLYLARVDRLNEADL